MSVSNNFLDYILDQLSMWGNVSVKRMFGGAGLYRDGKMFGLVSHNVVYLKVDDTNREKFLVRGASPFKPFPNRPTILSFYELPEEILESPDEFIKWAKESLSIQKKRSDAVLSQ